MKEAGTMLTRPVVEHVILSSESCFEFAGEGISGSLSLSIEAIIFYICNKIENCRATLRLIKIIANWPNMLFIDKDQKFGAKIDELPSISN